MTKEADMSHHIALWIAWKAGSIGPVYFVSDKWGGYYQTETSVGPYTFRAGTS